MTLGCIINGRTMQQGSTSDMIFSVAELIAFLSRDTTLVPGTLILTGTPPGVGFARKPPVFLADGDRVEIRIEGIGTLENPVVDARRQDADS
jgi:2-keto-4-pentenoate hydratase/2-oxohepta-3-ene-1,7-dioic acid hydratase in catechol pathway